MRLAQELYHQRQEQQREEVCNMWNSNSRTWLVTRISTKRKQQQQQQHENKAVIGVSNSSLSRHRLDNKINGNHIKCGELSCSTWQNITKTKSNHISSLSRSLSTSLLEEEEEKVIKFKYSCSRKIGPKSIKDTRVYKVVCLNQIVEVLLVILLLANCLLAHTHAAIDFGSASSSSSSSSKKLSSSRVSRFSSSRDNDYHDSEELQQLSDISSLWQTHSAFRQQRFNSVVQTNYKISPKPCSISGIDGTCMFVWECIKSEGRHVGMCVDAFMFGSCCVHNYTDNIVIPPSFSYTRPTKPGLLGGSGSGSGGGIDASGIYQHHRPRPPPFAGTPHRPVISGMTTIERPHGAGTLVIRPSGPHHQGSLQRPHPYSTKTPSTMRPTFSTSTRKPTTTTTRTTTTNNNSGSTSLWESNDMQTSASFSPSAMSVPSQSLSTWNNFAGLHQHQHHTMSTLAGINNNEPHQQSSTLPTITTTIPSSSSSSSSGVLQHWHMTTEPNFITKPRPPSWEKPLPPVRPKPKPKPTKPTKTPLTPSFVYTSYYRNTTTTTTSTTMATSTTTTKTTTTKRPITTIIDAIIEQTTKARPQITVSPTTLRPIMRPPTPAWITSESAFSHEHFHNNFSFSSTSFKPISTTTTKPTITTNEPLTIKTTTSTSTTTLKPTAFTSTSTSEDIGLPTHKNYSNIEINEIADTSNSDGTIKLISAARSECGVPTITRPETRIVGGKSSVFGHWPWQVSVRRTTFFGFSSTHRCGGALINENWISTAGHCVDDLLISQIRIRVGEYDFAHVQEQLQYIERGVVKKVVHPKYNFYTYEYDLALVKLESPLDFAPHVSPICLPQTDSLLIGMNATVTGWGRLSEGGTLPSVLQEASVPIVSNDNCKSMFLRAGRLEIIPEIFLCAGYETGGQDSCQGDSGGPLQVKAQDGRYFLAGIISWGIGCAEANLPGVCTRISKFVPWIMENVT